MKTLKKIALSLLAVTAISITSCKDDDDSSPLKDAEKNLTGSFLLVNATDLENGVVVDTYSNYDPCDQDDVLSFNTDKTGAFSEGVTQCDPSDPSTTPFTWNLRTETQLDITTSILGFPLTVGAEIIRNDGINLDVKIEFFDEGDTITSFESYVKQ